MSLAILPPDSWAAEQFESVQLGDRRLSKRAVQVGAAIAADPAGSIPKQNKSWSRIKGAYRLFDSESVTYESLSRPHWQQTRLAADNAAVLCFMRDIDILPVTHGFADVKQAEQADHE